MPAAKRDFYHELGVQPDASPEDIRAAYRTLAKKYHPDLNHGDAKAKERFQRIGEAYSTLSDPKRRMEYHHRHGIKMEARAAKQAARPRPAPTGESFGVILKRAFKSGLGILNREGSSTPKPQRGRNLHTKISLNPMQLARGGTFLLKISRQVLCESCGGAGVRPGGRGSECGKCLGLGEVPASKGGKTIFVTCPQCEGTGFSSFVRCETCNGEGRRSAKVSLRIKVPANSRDGQELHIRRQGHAGAFGGEDGDLVVRLEESSERGVNRDGDDLRVTLEVNLLEALGGAEVEVPTPDGTRKIQLNAGVLAGRPLRLKQQGLRREDGGRGDLVVMAVPRIPDTVDGKAAELLKQLVDLPGWKVER